jgi:UDPglucose 6-dehydrogenase
MGAGAARVSGRVAVCGLWHLGSVTAACLAGAGRDVVAFDPDPGVVGNLKQGRPPVAEPGLAELVAAGIGAGRLRFTDDPAELEGAAVLWVTFDTPVNERDEADVAWLGAQLDAVRPSISAPTLVLISSQVPAGFTRATEAEWGGDVRFAYSPENLRLGRALESFQHPDRIVAGAAEQDRALLAELFEPFCRRIEWMTIESAEMTKHALNAFLATSVAFINEVARICEAVGADAREVERGLKSEPRIGPRSYLAPGAAFAGGTLARDVRFLETFGRDHRLDTPLLTGVLTSNERHRRWLFDAVERALRGVEAPVAAVLGLTYKAGTDTLRRSMSVELCRWLHARGVRVRAHDPAIAHLPPELAGSLVLCGSTAEALDGADVAVVSTEWPVFRDVPADRFVAAMRRPQVIDPNRFLGAVAGDPRLRYVAVGVRPREN